MGYVMARIDKGALYGNIKLTTTNLNKILARSKQMRYNVYNFVSLEVFGINKVTDPLPCFFAKGNVS
jgi:hypothetical protein